MSKETPTLKEKTACALLLRAVLESTSPEKVKMLKDEPGLMEAFVAGVLNSALTLQMLGKELGTDKLLWFLDEVASEVKKEDSRPEDLPKDIPFIPQDKDNKPN